MQCVEKFVSAIADSRAKNETEAVDDSDGLSESIAKDDSLQPRSSGWFLNQA